MSVTRDVSSSSSARNGRGLSSDQEVRKADADPPARKRRDKALDEELNQDVMPARAEGLPDTNLTRALLDVDEHDVHDPDAANRERQHADEREDDLEPRDDAADDLLHLRRAEHVRGPFVGRVEAIPIADVLAHLLFGSWVLRR